MSNRLAATIKAHRERLGWSQYDLAEHAKISQQLASKLEKPGSEASWRVLESLARAFRVPTQDFLIEAGLLDLPPLEMLRSIRPTAELDKLERIWENLSSRERAVLLRTAEALAAEYTANQPPAAQSEEVDQP